jgi:hypothetical protein
MSPIQERLGSTAAVKGTMVEAHLQWAASKLADSKAELAAHLAPEPAALLKGRILPIHWIPLRTVVAIDRAIAAAVGGSADQVFRELGRHSAKFNLEGVYRSYASEDPHVFFEKQAQLHSRFCNFGRAEYTQTGPRSGRIALLECDEYSPVFCLSGLGYYEAALELMNPSGKVRVSDFSCVCRGDAACVVDLAW